MPHNESNFLIWYNDNEDVFATDLPRPFVSEPEALSPVVWLVAGDTIQFYVNTLLNVPLPSSVIFLYHLETNTPYQPE